MEELHVLRLYLPPRTGSHSVFSGGERVTGVKADTREPNGLSDNVDKKTS